MCLRKSKVCYTWAWLAARQEAEIRIKELVEEILGLMYERQH